MAKKVIITIARQYGSGGREVGEKVSEKLNIPIYDKLLITEAAAKGEFNEDVLKMADESAASSLLYTLAMGSNSLGAAMHFGYKMPLNDKLFLRQSDVIREYAESGSGIFIGRCADYVLKNEEKIIRVFIYGDLEHRCQRVLERHPDLKSSQVIDVINKVDKRRSTYYNFYTGNKWGKFDNYDIAINSSNLGIEGTADIICRFVDEIMKK